MRAVLRAGADLAGTVRPQAASLPPWERSVLDDVAARRPWNLRVKAERLRARYRRGGLGDGVTVVIVNWNTRQVTADVLRAVQALTPTEVDILVVDNGSSDGSAQMLREWPGIDTMLLRSNAGHGVALDLALCRVRTTVAVTLDSDAVPLRPGWLEPVVDPVRSGRALLAGLRSSRNFVHPVFCAIDTATFLDRRLSFQAFVPPGLSTDSLRWGENVWDTAELMTQRLGHAHVAFVDRTENPAPGLPGMTTGGVVYHHGGVSRRSDGQVGPEALDSWRDALGRIRAVGLLHTTPEPAP